MDVVVINGWYIAAILLSAGAAFCAYYGSVVDNRRNSDAQSTHLEQQLQKLGTQIQELRQEPHSSSKSAEIEAVDERYKKLAEEFVRSAPLRSAQEGARTAQQLVQEVQKTQEVEAYFQYIWREAEKLAAAYNGAANKTVLEIQGNPVPENIFRAAGDHPAYVLLKFEGPKFWCVRIVSYPDRTLALQFVRLLSPDGSSNYQTMRLTDDSVNVVLFDEQFGFSLNQSISDAVKANVTASLPTTKQPIDLLQALSVDLVRRIIEYELLSSS